MTSPLPREAFQRGAILAMIKRENVLKSTCLGMLCALGKN